jgi:hypothetical protein
MMVATFIPETKFLSYEIWGRCNWGGLLTTLVEVQLSFSFLS